MCGSAKKSYRYWGARWRDCQPQPVPGRPLSLNGVTLLATTNVVPASETAAKADGWGFATSDLGHSLLSQARGRAKDMPAELLKEALRGAGLTENPFPETTGTLAMESRLPEVLMAAQAELANADPKEREHWRIAGLAEHASVGSFAKLCLELLVAGAPPRLLRHAIKAQEEELVHAHLSLGLLRGTKGNLRASSAEGESGIESLDLPEHNIEVKRDLAALRSAAIEEGLMGEGRAALQLFQRSLEALHGDGKEPSAGQRALAELAWAIGHDEAHHAALAMEIVEWLHEATKGPPLPKVDVSAGTVLVQETS